MSRCSSVTEADASHILSSVTSSLTRLALANPSAPDNTAMSHLAQLVRALHHCQTDFKWDIATPALRRASAVEARLNSIGEHETVAAALRSGETATPIRLDSFRQTFDQTQNTVETEPQYVWDWGGLDWNFIDLLGDTAVPGT